MYESKMKLISLFKIQIFKNELKKRKGKMLLEEKKNSFRETKKKHKTRRVCIYIFFRKII